MRTATFSDSVLWPGWTILRKIWRSICEKNDISERPWVIETWFIDAAAARERTYTPALPSVTSRISLRGARAWVADRQQGSFVFQSKKEDRNTTTKSWVTSRVKIQALERGEVLENLCWGFSWRVLQEWDPDGSLPTQRILWHLPWWNNLCWGMWVSLLHRALPLSSGHSQDLHLLQKLKASFA